MSRTSSTRALTLLCLLAVLPACLVSCVPSQAERLARSVEIRRTAYGVPHILAESLDGAAFGLAWAMMEDYREQVPRQILRANGRLSLALGRDELEADFPGRLAHDFAVETFPLLPRDVQQILTGFAAGVNHFIERRGAQLPEWVTPTFTPQDIHARDVQAWDMGAVRRFIARRGSDAAGVEPVPDASDTAGVESAPDPSDTTGVEPASDPFDTTAAGPGFDSEVGSNVWALAPSRTKSGHAILMRNPHLSWDAGYYEAQVTVPGVLNFYGDFRLGGPFGIIGGFNERLGWATTNNYPDLDEIYAFEVDPERPDHYLLDGESVPIERETVVVEFRNGPSLGQETREILTSRRSAPSSTGSTGRCTCSAAAYEGDVPARGAVPPDDAGVEPGGVEGGHADAGAPVNSNFTYADADGNIFYVWNATIPCSPTLGRRLRRRWPWRRRTCRHGAWWTGTRSPSC
jgi:acyl-homoserine-lactone acylase